jgi:broad specificity phosphatase PhoE
MSTILLVRHGETDWNRSGQIMGARPIPLNWRGETQARTLARFLRHWASRSGFSSIDAPAVPGLPPFDRDACRLLSSPVHRAAQTASILGEALGLRPRSEAGLSEIGLGEWEGRYWNEIGDDPGRRQFYSHPGEARPPGGETLGEVQARAIVVIQRALAEKEAGTFVLVSHADVIRSILAHSLELPLQQTRAMRIDNASLTGLSLSPDPSSLLFLNYVPADRD